VTTRHVERVDSRELLPLLMRCQCHVQEKSSLAWAMFALGKMSTDGKMIGADVSDKLQQCLVYHSTQISTEYAVMWFRWLFRITFH